MYSSRGTNAYGQQSYVGQSGYSQNLGAVGYSGSSVGGPNGGAQMPLSSRHSSILGSSQDAEVGGYRAHTSVSAHYGGQYSSIYGTAALSATQQVPAASSKGRGASALEDRNAYASTLPDSPKFASTDYISSSSHGYNHKGDQMYADKIPDYPTVERRQFGERQGGYLGRDLPNEPTGRYSDSIFGHQHQPDIYDRLDQAVLLRQEQLLKSQSVSNDSCSRGSSKENVDDLMYPPSSANPGYGVSLPPGRDYGTKGLHVTTLESEYPGSTLSRKDDRAGYLREFEMREEERRRIICVKERKTGRGNGNGSVNDYENENVYSSNLTDVERGYLSIDKRCPRLFVCPEFSKVVINWPKENLKLSMHTHVSFEHDFIEDSLAESKEHSSKLVPAELEKPEQGSTMWNAKMILMSGLSRSALEELSSEKVPDDRIPHICNILRFAVLKKDHSFMAIGGPCVYADGSNPAGDEFSLIQTALRYAKEVVNLDLKKCQNWNPFLEIHYDRIGKDGLFSHKEVTVLFVPDLSECRPSLDTWRAQLLAHRKAVSERERQLCLKREKSKERKEGSKDKEADSTKQTEKGKSGKKIQSVSSSYGVVANKKEKDGKSIEGGATEGKVTGGEKNVQVKDGSEITVEGGPEKKESGEAPAATATATAKTGAVKSVKKKIIKRIVKQKVATKTAVEVNIASKQSNRVDEDVGEQNTKSETTGQQEESSAASAGSEDNGVPPEAKVEVETGCSEDKPKDNSDVTSAAVENAGVKTTIKKKIIKRVPKRKVPPTQAKGEVAEIKNEGGEDDKRRGESQKMTKILKMNPRVILTKNQRRRKPEEPSLKNPGLILQTKWSKDSKLRPVSLSLDSLLDYTDKDIEESTFELSLFAEVMYEMLQYQMGCRILTFLQKLRLRFMSKRNQRKRQREEIHDKETKKKSPMKKSKSSELPVKKNESAKADALSSAHENFEMTVTKEDITADHVEEPRKTAAENSADHVEEPNIKDEVDEDSEEDPEEYEEMDDANPQPNSSNEKNEEKEQTEAKPDKEAEKNEAAESTKSEIATKAASMEPDPEGDVSRKEEQKVDPKKKVYVTDKDLLQVEDMRLIIHSLGKFLSHRDVKELVQSALLESNTGRDDHILYDKLVRMSDV
ncbi:ATP/GTP-binding family protein, putative isoform 2 [Hibiscus syriacus]|uniref:ATP/GTP-binding family protein, putative isoform 2 n=1 Tax=Hibiscus syriacus TaxID=106335 RepID=A0A6A2WUV2_HIBSY|nr:ATP/GTP-binding family protein, putative isoform 2 [Hibiscus syriacus]